MVISHKHRYVFLELPFTATRAISRELQENYAGEQILCKHSNFPEFARYASSVERRYFVFCGVRNPLQVPVSLFLKYRNASIDDLWLGKDRGWNPAPAFHAWMSRRRVAYAQREGTTFEDYFLKYYRWPYDDWSRVSLPNCDYVVRFESIQEDFAAVLEQIGVRQVRELPRRGNAVSWSHDPAGYYGPRSRARAKWIFGPYMQRWNYEFPADWGESSVSLTSDVADRSLAMVRVPYWKWIRGMIDIDLHAKSKDWVHAA